MATGAALAASLVARVPDLPSAADLELGVGDRATTRPELPPEALPAPEVETLELDLGATELLFPSVTEPSPDLAPVPLDLDMAAFEEAIAREDAPTEIMPVGEVVAEAPAAAERRSRPRSRSR